MIFISDHLWNLVAMLLLLVASFMASGTETALFNLSRGQLYRMRHSSDLLYRRVSALMRRPRRVLNALLLANLLVTVAYAGLGSLLVIDLERADGAAWLLAVASLVPLVALILLGEVAPKMIAYAVAPRWAAAAAVPAAALERGLSPIFWIMETAIVGPLARVVAPRRAETDITAEELGALLDLSARRGLIAHDANALLQEIVELTELRVGDIMVPRVDMIAYDINDPPQGLVELFRTSHLRKIPVYDGQPDNILGVIYGKSLLLEFPEKSGKGLRDLVVKVPFVPAAGNVERLLIQFRVTRKQMAIVVDEFGGVAGLVTLQNIIEEIVGDIPDRRDETEQPPVERTSERQFVIDGDLAIHEWSDAFKMDLSPGRISTMGGFVTSLLGRIPRAGDQARYRNLLFTVVSTRGRRVGKLQVELAEEGSS